MAVRKHGTLLVALSAPARDMESSWAAGRPDYRRFEDQSEEYTVITESKTLLESRIPIVAGSADELPPKREACNETNHIELEILDTHHLLYSPPTNRSAIVGSPLCVSASSLGQLSPPRTGGHRVFLSPQVKRLSLQDITGDETASGESYSNIANLSTLSVQSANTPNGAHSNHLGRLSPPPSYILTQDLSTLTLGDLAVLIAELRADIDDRSQELICDLEQRDKLELAGCNLRHVIDELQSASTQSRRRTILRRRSSCGSRPDVYVALD